MRFMKKPVIVEAEQYTDSGELPFLELGVVEFDEGANRQYVNTLEGKMWVNDGDWIIKGVKGEFYPCKPDIFAETYELVREHAEIPVPDFPTEVYGKLISA